MGFSGAPQVRRLFDFCWPVALAAGMNWAQMQGYRFLLAERVGLAELGMFAAGYGLAASLMAAMETVLTTWFQPKFYRQANASDRETRASAWQKYAAIMLPSSMLGFSALVASAPYLTVIMLGPAYQDSWRYVMLGALAEWTRVLVGLFGLIAHLGMNTRTLILPNLIGCSVTYAILLWLQPKFGLDAAPVSVAVGGFVVAAYLYFDSRNSDYLIKIDWNGLLKTFIFISLMMLVIAQARPWIVKIGSSSAPYLGVALISTLWGVFAFWMLYQNRVQQHSKG
jgi:O-antigen/teichoic acid export membrane protein